MTDNTCSICLEPLLSKPGKSIGTAVPCGHCFHTKCFNRWKASRHSRFWVPCPNCNKATDGFIKLFIACNLDELQCMPASSSEEEPSKAARKSPAVVIVPSPPRLSRPSRIAQDPPTRNTPRISATPTTTTTTITRASNSVSAPIPVNRTESESTGRIRIPRPGSRRGTRFSPFRTRRVQDDNNNITNHGAPVISRRRHSSRSLSRMLQLSKMVKDLKVAQQSIVKQVHDHRAMVFTLGTCRQDQQTKRVCRLKASQTKLTTELEEHQASLEDLPLDSLRRRDVRRVEELQTELELKLATHREQVELVNSLYSTRLSQERTRVARLRDEQRQLNETLRDYGAAIKALHHNNKKSAGVRLRGRKQRHLTTQVSSLGDAIQSINLGMLERDHCKKMKQVESDLIALVQRVGDHGASIQSLCSVHHFLGTSLLEHEC